MYPEFPSKPLETFFFEEAGCGQLVSYTFCCSSKYPSTPPNFSLGLSVRFLRSLIVIKLIDQDQRSHASGPLHLLLPLPGMFSPTSSSLHLSQMSTALSNDHSSFPEPLDSAYLASRCCWLDWGRTKALPEKVFP